MIGSGVRGGPPRGGLQPPAAPARGCSRMPEGDTIHRAARRMDAALRGREMVLADAPNPRSPIHGRAKKLEGSVLERVEARGKHLLAHFSSGDVIHSHLGMNGRWFIAADGRMPYGKPWLVLSSGRGIASQNGRQAPPAHLGIAGAQRPRPGAARPRSARRLVRRCRGRDAASAAWAPAARSATRCSTSGSSRASGTRSETRRSSAPGSRRFTWSEELDAEQLERIVSRERARDADLDGKGKAAALRLPREPARLPCVRRAHRGARPGRRQPHGLLVPACQA